MVALVLQHKQVLRLTCFLPKLLTVVKFFLLMVRASSAGLLLGVQVPSLASTFQAVQPVLLTPVAQLLAPERLLWLVFWLLPMVVLGHPPRPAHKQIYFPPKLHMLASF
jgi:hypothetical protein